MHQKWEPLYINKFKTVNPRLLSTVLIKVPNLFRLSCYTISVFCSGIYFTFLQDPIKHLDFLPLLFDKQVYNGRCMDQSS